MSPHDMTNGASKDLRCIPLSYSSAESESSALSLVLALSPNWEHTEGKVEFIRFTDGITNTLLKAVKQQPGYTEEQVDKEAVLLRAYGKGTEVLIDRERETTSHSLLSQHNLAPPLLARFANGLLYRFIRGKVCNPEDLTREAVWRGVARRLGEWHAVLPIVTTKEKSLVEHGDNKPTLSRSQSKPITSIEEINAITPGKATPNLWTVMQKWIFALPNNSEAERERKKILQKELERSVTELGSTPGLGQDGLVFGHCDLLSGNVILQPQQHTNVKTSKPSIEDVAFIDYEYATPSPPAFDIANHFAEWGGFACDYHALPTRSQRFAFLIEYLSSYTSHSNPQISIPSAHQLFAEIDSFRGIPGLYWGIWALIQATISQIDFDYAAYAEKRLGEYWAWRAETDCSRANEGKEIPLRERRWAQESD